MMDSNFGPRIIGIKAVAKILNKSTRQARRDVTVAKLKVIKKGVHHFFIRAEVEKLLLPPEEVKVKIRGTTAHHKEGCKCIVCSPVHRGINKRPHKEGCMCAVHGSNHLIKREEKRFGMYESRILSMYDRGWTTKEIAKYMSKSLRKPCSEMTLYRIIKAAGRTHRRGAYCSYCVDCKAKGITKATNGKKRCPWHLKLRKSEVYNKYYQRKKEKENKLTWQQQYIRDSQDYFKEER